MAVFRETVERKHLRTKVTLVGAPRPASGDRRAVEQVLTNLFENAVKYCPDGATITVRIAVREGDGSGRDPKIRVSVEDTGPGIERSTCPVCSNVLSRRQGRSRDMAERPGSVDREASGRGDGRQGRRREHAGQGTILWFTLRPREPGRTRSSPPDASWVGTELPDRHGASRTFLLCAAMRTPFLVFLLMFPPATL